jgi:ABC-2 type transport system permease protein
MPIHDLSYQRWNGPRVERSAAWILGRGQLRALLRRRPVRFALSASLVLTLAWGAAIYLESQLSRLGPLAKLAGGLSIDTAAFHRFLTVQRLLHWLLCVAAADAIALDRRHRALQILLARPVRKRDYVIGKAGGIAVVLALASWIPALVLVLFKIAVRADVAWLASDPYLIPGVLGYGTVLMLAATLVTLGVSSLSNSPRQASGQMFAFLAVSEAVSAVLAALTGRDGWRALSVSADLDQMASWFFGLERAHDFPPQLAALALAGIVLVAAGVLARSVRAVQVVGGS